MLLPGLNDVGVGANDGKRACGYGPSRQRRLIRVEQARVLEAPMGREDDSCDRRIFGEPRNFPQHFLRRIKAF